MGLGRHTVVGRDVHARGAVLVVGDAEGVIVLPAHLADEIAVEAFEMTVFEDFVTEQVDGGRSIVGLYPATDPQTLTDFAAWRKQRGR